MKKWNKISIKKTLLLAIPLILIWISVLAYNLYVEKNYIVENIISENEYKDGNNEFLVNQYIEEIIENLKIIRDSNELEAFINDPTEDTLYETEEMFKRVMTNKVDYDQLRLLDKDGHEIIRADNEEEVVLASSDLLKDKSERYYFIETKELSKGEIYISPLDLNLEEEELEMPYKPMVRFATPIFDENDDFQGVLIINYKAEYFVEILESHDMHEEIDTFKFYVLNREGEFLLEQEEDNTFSIMLDKDMMPYSEKNKAVWEVISNKNTGAIRTTTKLITHYDVLSKTRELHSNFKERWIVIHEINIQDLFSVKTMMKELLVPRNLGVLLFIIIVSVIYAYTSTKIQSKDSQLEITELIAQNTNDGVLITDKDKNITYVNAAYEEITGYPENEILNRQPRDFKSGKQDEEFYKKMWGMIKKKGYWEGFLWDKRKNGLLYPAKMKIIAVKDKNNNEPNHYVSVLTDVSKEKNNENNLERITSEDGTFLIPNEEMMLQLLKQSIEMEEYSFMLLYISIENYNQLITSFKGFENKSAEMFSELIKPLINKDDFIAQSGRNIYLVTVGLKNMQSDPITFVNSIHKSLSKKINVKEGELFFKTRIGVSLWPQDTKDIKKLLLNSIIALDWVTNRRTKETAFFSENMIAELNQGNEIEKQLMTAVENKEFYMVYQPQVNSLSGKVIGMEALIRWKNKELGQIPPGIFIPIAERSKTIIDIGYWIVEQVCKDINEMMKLSNGAIEDMRCAVNLSSIQMEDDDFLNKFFHIISKNGIDFKQLEIEVTEGMLLTDDTKNISALNSFRKVGMTVAIDDFGTGYSSLSYLNTLPLDKIKIDRSFIKDFPDNDDGKLISVLVQMTEVLGISVLTEGAETKEQVEFLSEIGCSTIQGYFYSKPLEKREFLEYLEGRGKI